MTIHPKETQIQLGIIKYLASIGATVGKTKTMGVYSKGKYRIDLYVMRGKADLECFYKGIMYFIEIKSRKGVQSEYQKKYQELVHKLPDRIYILAHSLDDVIEIIK